MYRLEPCGVTLMVIAYSSYGLRNTLRYDITYDGVTASEPGSVFGREIIIIIIKTGLSIDLRAYRRLCRFSYAFIIYFFFFSARLFEWATDAGGAKEIPTDETRSGGGRRGGYATDRSYGLRRRRGGRRFGGALFRCGGARKPVAGRVMKSNALPPRPSHCRRR